MTGLLWAWGAWGGWGAWEGEGVNGVENVFELVGALALLAGEERGRGLRL